MQPVHGKPEVCASVQAACSRLDLKPPHPHLTVLPEADGRAKSVISVTAILFEKIGSEITLLMLKQKYKTGQGSFPGGFRAGATEDIHATPIPAQVEDECYFPTLTAARELYEEMTFLFGTTGKAYDFLNQPDTKTLTNNGWDRFPVLMYLHPLSNSDSEKVTQAIRGEIPVENAEVCGIFRVSLATLRQAFTDNKWTGDGLDKRSKLIDAAKIEGKTADLSSYPQYERAITLVDTAENAIEIAPPTARSIFNSLDKIETMAKQFFAA